MTSSIINDAGTIPTHLSAHFKRRLPRYLAGTLMLGAYQYCQYWFDLELESAIDAAFNDSMAVALATGRFMMVLAVGAFILRVASRVAIFNAGRIVEYELRTALLHRLHRLGPRFYGHMSSGEIMSRSTNDLTQVRLLLGFGVLASINTVFGLTSAIAVMLHNSGALTAIALCTFPVVFMAAMLFGRLVYRYTRQTQAALGRLSEKVQSSITGIRVVRSFALEDAELARFERVNDEHLAATLKLARLRGSMFPMIAVVIMIGGIFVFWHGGTLIMRGELSSGSFVAFTRALSRLIWPMISFGLVISIVQRGRAAYSRLSDIFAEPPEVDDGSTIAKADAAGRLEVRNLTFSYGAEPPALRELGFSIEPGRSLAILGQVGSGKSTLAQLLTRLQVTPANSVFLDGTDICELPLHELRARIGYAQQSAFLFSTTVADNIGFALDTSGDPARDRAIIESAAREACIYDEIAGLSQGFDTVVGERGVQLSGGQKQRIALARALVSSPPILILDDPLSAVDSATESAILDALDRQSQRRSVILITHRVSAAQRCDEVLVLERGRVAEQGDHDGLMAAKGLYASIADEQRRDAELEALSRSSATAPAPNEETSQR